MERKYRTRRPSWESDIDPQELEEFVDYLKAKSKSELIDIIVNLCENDPEIMDGIL